MTEFFFGEQSLQRDTLAQKKSPTCHSKPVLVQIKDELLFKQNVNWCKNISSVHRVLRCNRSLIDPLSYILCC